MIRLIKWMLNQNKNFIYRYVGDLPANYPAPGSEFMYRGQVGHIRYYCLHILPDGESAELVPVVSYAGREDLIYTLDMIYPNLKVNVVV